jgi:hypothetical protein
MTGVLFLRAGWASFATTSCKKVISAFSNHQRTRRDWNWYFIHLHKGAACSHQVIYNYISIAFGISYRFSSISLKKTDLVLYIYGTCSDSDDHACLWLGFSAGYVPSAKSLRHGAAKPPYILPRFTSLTDEQKSKVEEKLRGIQSEIPAYVAVMKNSNVNSRMCILVSDHFVSLLCSVIY